MGVFSGEISKSVFLWSRLEFDLSRFSEVFAAHLSRQHVRDASR